MCQQNDTHWINKNQIPTLERALEKFNKQATKLACPHVEYKVHGEKQVVPKEYQSQIAVVGEENLPKETLVEIELIGEAPVIEGWKFLGTLDHYSLPGAVIVNAVPGETIPDEFHTDDASCDHCGKVRRRNETFVLQEVDTGAHKRVGRQCVRDFIGYDPSSVLRFMRALERFEGDFEDEEKWSSGGGRQFYTFDHISVLTRTAAMIDKYGWVPRSAADEDHNATANDVLHSLIPPTYDARAYAAWKVWIAELNLDDPRWKKDAEAAREWLKEQTGTGSYWHNLHAIDEAEAVPAHLLGYWCSVMSGYYRAMERLRLAEREKKVNEHVGEVKHRRNFTVKLKKRLSFENAYGTTRLHIFLDEDGHTLVWWASTDPKMELDETYRVKATIKNHDERDGWKQTVITRLKVEEHIEQEAA